MLPDNVRQCIAVTCGLSSHLADSGAKNEAVKERVEQAMRISNVVP